SSRLNVIGLDSGAVEVGPMSCLHGSLLGGIRFSTPNSQALPADALHARPVRLARWDKEKSKSLVGFGKTSAMGAWIFALAPITVSDHGTHSTRCQSLPRTAG